MSNDLNDRIANLEMGIAHIQRMFDQLNEVVTAQSLENQRMERRLTQLQDQIKQVKDKPAASGDPLDEKPPHY